MLKDCLCAALFAPLNKHAASQTNAAAASECVQSLSASYRLRVVVVVVTAHKRAQVRTLAAANLFAVDGRHCKMRATVNASTLNAKPTELRPNVRGPAKPMAQSRTGAHQLSGGAAEASRQQTSRRRQVCLPTTTTSKFCAGSNTLVVHYPFSSSAAAASSNKLREICSTDESRRCNRRLCFHLKRFYAADNTAANEVRSARREAERTRNLQECNKFAPHCCRRAAQLTRPPLMRLLRPQRPTRAPSPSLKWGAARSLRLGFAPTRPQSARFAEPFKAAARAQQLVDSTTRALVALLSLHRLRRGALNGARSHLQRSSIMISIGSIAKCSCSSAEL